MPAPAHPGHDHSIPAGPPVAGRRQLLGGLAAAGAAAGSGGLLAACGGPGERVERVSQITQIDTLDPDPANTAAQAMRARCYERFAELQAERETTQAQLADLDHTPARDDDTTLLDDIPLLARSTDLNPERIQAALYQAFDIQALYKPGMDQVTIFATITTSTPQAVAALIADAGNDPASATPDPAPATPASPHRPPAAPPFTLWHNPLFVTEPPRSWSRLGAITTRPAPQSPEYVVSAGFWCSRSPEPARQALTPAAGSRINH